MTWVVVSFINVIEVSDGKQSEFPIEEQFYLYEVHSKKELEEKIFKEKELINTAGESGVTYYGKNARQYCLGVRKVKSIFNQPPLDIDNDPPGDGSELIHSYMTVESLADAKNLAEGKAVNVYYIDDDSLE